MSNLHPIMERALLPIRVLLDADLDRPGLEDDANKRWKCEICFFRDSMDCGPEKFTDEGLKEPECRLYRVSVLRDDADDWYERTRIENR